MEYKLEQLSPTEKKIHVTASAEEVNGALIATLALYRKSADIKGFRKGKVPSSVIEARYRKQIYSEAASDLINYHLTEIMSELKETPLSGLTFEGQSELVKNADLAYSFTYEVVPDFELPDYKGIEIEEEEAVLDPDDVEKVLNRFRENMAKLEIVKEPRQAADGDIAVFDFKGFENGAPLEGVSANNMELELGRGNALEGFEAIVKTLRPGEEGEGEVTFPDDFLNRDLAGKTVQMKVSLHTIKEKILPEVNEELAAKANYASLQDMRQAIEKSYMESKRQLHKSDSQKKLLDALKAKVDFPLPASVIEKHVSNMLYETLTRLERQGKDLSSTGKTEAELREEYREKAKDISKSQVFLLAVAKAESISVTPQEVDNVLRRMAISSGQDFHSLKDFYERNNLMFDLRDSVLADKAMDFMYEQAKVSHVRKMDSPATEEEKEKKTKVTSKKKAEPKEKKKDK